MRMSPKPFGFPLSVKDALSDATLVVPSVMRSSPKVRHTHEYVITTFDRPAGISGCSRCPAQGSDVPMRTHEYVFARLFAANLVVRLCNLSFLRVCLRLRV